MRAASSLNLAASLLIAACGVNQTPQPAPSNPIGACVPDRDGTITAAEVPVPLGFTATYYVGSNSPVPPGTTEWDMSEERASDAVVALGPVALVDQWYAAEFPGGAFVTDAGGDLDGVFHQDEQGLWLHGTASREPGSNKTLVHYAEPIAVLRFPLADGDAFEATEPLVDATISGLPFVGSDKVSVEVDGEGRLDLPYVRFSPTLRVRTTVVRTPSTGAGVTKRSVSWLFECFGEVAHAESKVDETDPDFPTAATLRRFALGVTP